MQAFHGGTRAISHMTLNDYESTHAYLYLKIFLFLPCFAAKLILNLNFALTGSHEIANGHSPPVP